ncbi:hypothetical protein CYMTET_20677 [Cymbomonas tetramitiformis]|uniref:Uncharacterized protein n=1 Tax=Cymbomonas tetramitiformis TaxID=36881 RepID=A0AAE0L3R1_9CHLO|nr:hypothetical protein CYMTET_20677 [Cymbomonas tetramitiformis]
MRGGAPGGGGEAGSAACGPEAVADEGRRRTRSSTGAIAGALGGVQQGGAPGGGGEAGSAACGPEAVADEGRRRTRSSTGAIAGALGGVEHGGSGEAPGSAACGPKAAAGQGRRGTRSSSKHRDAVETRLNMQFVVSQVDTTYKLTFAQYLHSRVSLKC